MGAGKVIHKADTSFGGQKKDLWLRLFLSPDSDTFMDKTESVFAAGFNYDRDNYKQYRQAQRMGCKLFKRHIPQIEKFLKSAGLSQAEIIQGIREGFEATRIIHATNEGVISDMREVPDFAVRKQYLDLGAKVLGMLAPQKVEHSGGQVFIIETGFSRDPDELPSEEDPFI